MKSARVISVLQPAQRDLEKFPTTKRRTNKKKLSQASSNEESVKSKWMTSSERVKCNKNYHRSWRDVFMVRFHFVHCLDVKMRHLSDENIQKLIFFIASFANFDCCCRVKILLTSSSPSSELNRRAHKNLLFAIVVVFVVLELPLQRNFEPFEIAFRELFPALAKIASKAIKISSKYKLVTSISSLTFSLRIGKLFSSCFLSSFS